MSVDPTNNDLELYMSSLEQYRAVRELYWTRVSSFLVIQGLLFASLSLTQSFPRLILLLSSFGVLFSGIWYTVMQLGEESVISHRRVVLKLEEELQVDFPLLRMAIEHPSTRETRLGRFTVTRVQEPELSIPILTALFWLAVIAFYGFVVR